MDTKNAVDFPYKPLDEKRAMVRLIRIYRDRERSITGKLEEFYLDSLNCPGFMTLSYVCKIPHRKIPLFFLTSFNFGRPSSTHILFLAQSKVVILTLFLSHTGTRKY
jgi:hypothetical protein